MKVNRQAVLRHSDLIGGAIAATIVAYLTHLQPIIGISAGGLVAGLVAYGLINRFYPPARR